jgi:hypothetical protein
LVEAVFGGGGEVAADGVAVLGALFAGQVLTAMLYEDDYVSVS